MRNNNNMEIFKNNLEEQGFSIEFIKKSIEYFIELNEEMEVQEMENLEEVIQYYDKIGSFSCNTLKSEGNLKELRKDIALLKDEYPELLDINLYFTNIEGLELQLLYTLYYKFYPQEDEEENL